MPAIKYQTRSRQSGAFIALFDAKDPANVDDFSGSPERWVLVCLNHGARRAFAKQDTAYKSMTTPDWCDGCKKLMANGEKAQDKPDLTFDQWAGSSTEQSTGAPSPETVPESDDTTITTSDGPESEDEVQVSEPEDASSNLVQSTTLDVALAAAQRDNTCNKCGGTLKASDGHWHSSSFPVKPICCNCAGHSLEAESASQV